MGGRFRKRPGGGAGISLSAEEKGVLQHLFTELVEFVEPAEAPAPPIDPLAAMVDIGPQADLPADPALARLLPDAYPDDPEATADFRRFTEQGLRGRKTAAARTVLTSLEQEGRIRLDAEQARAWLTSLTDLRLVLGTRLGVTDDPASSEWEPEATDPRSAMLGVYDWLGWLQETLVRALSP
jgi:hypothetical protein